MKVSVYRDKSSEHSCWSLRQARALSQITLQCFIHNSFNESDSLNELFSYTQRFQISNAHLNCMQNSLKPCSASVSRHDSRSCWDQSGALLRRNRQNLGVFALSTNQMRSDVSQPEMCSKEGRDNNWKLNDRLLMKTVTLEAKSILLYLHESPKYDYALKIVNNSLKLMFFFFFFWWDCFKFVFVLNFVFLFKS